MADFSPLSAELKIRLTEQQKRDLEAVAAHIGAQPAQLARMAIVHYLADYPAQTGGAAHGR
jgi:hypothetical protein